MSKKIAKNDRIGSSLDDLLEEENLLEELTAKAKKKVLAYQLAEEMRLQDVNKSEMARRMNTSRSQVNNLLDPDNNRFQMDTAEKAASALGKRLIIELA